MLLPGAPRDGTRRLKPAPHAMKQSGGLFALAELVNAAGRYSGARVPSNIRCNSAAGVFQAMTENAVRG